MNFYKRFIGDIQAKTGGLTLAEFGAYDRLLDHYYSTEKPIDFEEIYRICRAMNSAEKRVVDKVLSKFFERSPEGYIQRKADEVIAKALPLIEAARENGKKGGRPPKPKTQTEPNGFSKQNPAETQMVKALQSQSQISPSDEGDGTRKRVARPDDVTAKTWNDWNQLRKSKRATVTETVVDGAREQAGLANVSLEDFLKAWCRRGSQGFEASWLKADERGTRQPPPNKHAAAARAIWDDTNQPDYIDAETN